MGQVRTVISETKPLEMLAAVAMACFLAVALSGKAWASDGSEDAGATSEGQVAAQAAIVQTEKAIQSSDVAGDEALAVEQVEAVKALDGEGDEKGEAVEGALAAGKDAKDAGEDATSPEIELANDDDGAEGSGASTQEGPLADGVYSIQSLVGESTVLDLAGASRSSGGNIQVYGSNNTDAQKWRLTFANGFYTIASMASGLVLDVSGAATYDGANVQQYAGNGTQAQKWTLRPLGNGVFAIVSALDSNKVLDVSGGSSADGTNVHIWTSNGTAAQRWFFAKLDGIRGERIVDDGVYEISSALGGGSVDISGGSYNNGTNIQVYASNGTNAQRWAFVWNEQTATYSIFNAANGKALDVYGANPAPATNVTQYAANGTNAQRWVLQKTGSQYTIVSAVSGMALDVAGGSKSSGANIWVYRPNGTNAQKWTLKATDGAIVDGMYNIYSMLSPEKQVMDVTGASRTSGTQLETYQHNGTFAQKFRVAHVSGDVYTVQAMCSAMYLVNEGGKLVQKANPQGDENLWTIAFSGSGLRLTSAADSSKSVGTSKDSAANGTSLIVTDSVQAAKQLWRFQVVNLIENGYYVVRNANSGKVLDVSGASYLAGANVAQYDANGSGAQVFYIADQGGGAYSIMNAKSRKVLDVQWGSKDNNANVQQYYWNGSGAQLWIAKLNDDCSLTFTNKNSGKVLEVAGASKSNGGNVRQSTANGTAAQGWFIEPTGAWSLTGNAELDDYVATIVESNGGDLRRCFDWMSTLGHVQSLDSSLRYGIMGNDVVNHYALLVKWNGAADCYGDASLFALLARGCGYDANFRGGSCASASRGWVPHGWTEVYINGVTYVCDANLRRDLPGYNWYMVTYDSAPTGYLL